MGQLRHASKQPTGARPNTADARIEEWAFLKLATIDAKTPLEPQRIFIEE
jgi:hypothetical protein